MATPLGPDTQPLPNGGWSEEMRVLPEAMVVPPVTGGFIQPAGILDEAGRYRPEGALWRKYRALTTEPDPPAAPPERLVGRWLWGGVLWAHFGHFLVESSARLWALDHLDTPVDGILFMPKRPRVGTAIRGFQRDFIGLMAPGLPIRVVATPTRIETLVVPGQGFGLGLITAGTERFRTAIHDNFARGVAADGPEKLYISRSALGASKGGLLGEEKLEELLTAEGYTVFHPEKHDIATQVARYKAARRVVAADGSALHLFAMVGRPHQSVAMILRRRSSANNLLATHVARFTGVEPLVISALRTEWVRKGSGKSNRLSFGELDHARIGLALADGGFVARGADWPVLSDAERQVAFAQKKLDQRGNFIESPAHVRRRLRAARRAKRAG